jgi:glycosyltransferase involved in cell wall biosynthesis
MTIDVSICLPVMNGEKYLEEALNSVLAQNFSNFELLINDDCSDDSSWSIIQRFAAQDERITARRNSKRLGLFENYNEIIERSTGRLIKPFAQDDLLAPQALESMVQAMRDNASAVMVSCKRSLNGQRPPAENGQAVEAGEIDTLDSEQATLAAGLSSGKTVIEACLKNYRNLVGEPVSVMFRRNDRAMKFDYEYLSLGDLDLWLRLLEAGDFVFIDEPLVQFRQHQGSQTQRLLTDVDWVLDFLRLSRVYEKHLTDMKIDRAEYCAKFVDLAAPLVAANVSKTRDYIDSLAPHKELAYYLLRRLPRAIDGENNYNAVLQSTSWKLTQPVRAISKRLGGK